MSDVGAVVAYLGELAEQDTPFRPTVADPIFLPSDPKVERTAATNAGLKRLEAIDLLHREEQLVREGNFWIMGTIDGVNYRWPICQRRISLGTNRAVTMHSVDDSMSRFDSSWFLSPGLIEDAELRDIALVDDVWNRDFANAPLVSGFIRNDAGFEVQDRLDNFLQRYLAAAGLPDLELRAYQGKTTEPYILPARGFFLERHPFELNRASALKLWRDQELSQTVLAAIYDEGNLPEYEHDTAVLSPLPLNAAQRHAIQTARQRPVTVVSGPPGTGKSHMVAAAAIDQIAAGRSVLIASQSIHARDVVIDLLERYPMVEALRFGDDSSTRRLGDKLAAGVAATGGDSEVADVRRRCEQLEGQIADHRDRISRRITNLAGFADALVRRHDVPLWLAPADLDQVDVQAVSEAAQQLDASGLLGWFRQRSARKTIHKELGDKAPLDPEALSDITAAVAAEQLVNSVAGRNLGLDELWVELDRQEEQWRETIGDLLEAERRDRAGKKHLRALQELASALRMSPLKRREQLAGFDGRFLEVVPLWVGTLGEIEAVLPVEPGLFDLVILDEASQISQVSAVPALARARQAIIVGDSRQLRHVSFVSDASQATAAEMFGIPERLRSRLNDRTNSVFDAATAVAPVVELGEHFRSAPHLIGFSDREFYDGRLRLMTQHPRNEARDAIRVITVDGVRNDQRVVEAEVDEVMRLVQELIAANPESIGIVSPFRAQADAIEVRLLDELRLEQIASHDIRVGTVHSFQGTERDHMIISTGLGPDDSRARRFLEDPAVFNVMVTRARNHVTVVTSLDGGSAGSGLLAAYLRHAEEPPMLRRQNVAAAGWTARIAEDIAAQSEARVITGYEVAGETIDIVVGVGDDAFGIETEVHPGGAEQHIERRLALQRAGWDIVSLHRASCYGREEEVIASLLTRVSRMQRLG